MVARDFGLYYHGTWYRFNTRKLFNLTFYMKTITIPETLTVWEYYTNDQIHYALEVGNSWWIRPRLKDGKLNFVVLFTSIDESKNRSRNPYSDKIESEILTYTWAWLKWDQEISWANKRLTEQMENPVPILGFLKEDKNRYKFIGFLFLLRYYNDYQIDNELTLRKVLIFEFQIFSNIPTIQIWYFSEIFTPLYSNFKKNVLPEDTIVDSILPTSTESIKKPEISEEIIKDIENLKKKLLTIDPYEFEELMWKLITHTWFQNVHVTKKSWDDGIDVNWLIKHDLILDLTYQFQIKRWKHSVWRNEVANLRWSLWFNSFWVIISTSHFTSSAINEASSIGKVPINLVWIKDLYHIIKKADFHI